MLVEKEETASTNDDAHALAASGAPEGDAVLARRQSRGRGRAGRGFLSPEGGLYLSIVLRPPFPPAEWGLLPLAVGVAVVGELAASGFAPRLKWPNDVLLGGAKVGGILVESRWGASPYAIAGIGLNVAATPSGVPDATSLAAHGEAPAPRALAEALVARVLAVQRAWAASGRRVVLDEVRATCVTLGRRVEWEKGVGVAVDVADDGALVVEGDQGRVRVVAGDVRVRHS